MTSPPSAAPRRSGPLPWLLLYVFGVGLAFLAGYRMTVPYDFFQFLAKEPLRSRLGESLLNLHSQPPLLNLLLGLALKLERATGWTPERSLLVFHLALGGVATVALWMLLVRLGVNPWLRRLVMILVLLDPAFYIFLLLFFYSFHELVLLLLAAVAVQRFLFTRQVRFYAAACACLVTLTYTRTLFHFVWTLAVLAALALAARPEDFRRPVLGLLAASALLLLAWPAKNLLSFGFFGYSSWQGYNLSQGLVHEYPPIWAAFVIEDKPGREEAREALATTVPERFRSIPVLAEATKESGAPNWNHYSMILLSRGLERPVLRRLREHPSLLLAKAARNYRQAVIDPVRDPFLHTLEEQAPNPLAWIWLRVHEQGVYLYFGKDPQTGPLPGYAWLLPPALIFVAVQVVRRRRSDPAGAGTAALLLCAVVWVLAMVLFVDGREGNRMRFSTQPLLLAAVAWSLTRSPRSET